MSEATTPRPWKWETGSRTIRSARENYWLATMDSWDGQVNNDANAELIVRAVNAHDALIAVAQAVATRPYEDCTVWEHPENCDCLRIAARAALKLAAQD